MCDYIKLLIDWGYMKPDGFLTLRGQRMYLNNPNWVPVSRPHPEPTRGELDKWLGTKLVWEDATNRTSN